MAEEKQCKGLSHGAYEGVSGEDYEAYVPASKEIPELSWTAVILGIILSVVFGITMVYLGLKIGMTVSASIPAAVISMGILRGVFKRGNVLENNIVQTMTVSGEAIAAGLIFTIPAAWLWPEYASYHHPITLARLFLIAIIGGVLGVLMMIPLRNYLIVHEHGKLKYPEGTACAEVLVAGDIGGNPFKMVLAGILFGGLYKIFQQFGKLWKEIVSWDVPLAKNMVFSAELSPLLLGVGYIIGLEVALVMLAGGLLAWFVLIPLITYLGAGATSPILPATTLISQMSANDIRFEYVRYIGAGAVAMGGLISLAKSAPVIWASFTSAFKEFLNNFKSPGKNAAGGAQVKRTMKDLPIEWCLLISGVLIALIVFSKNISPDYRAGAIGALLVFVFGFFFVTVSSRLVGLIGSSSNPVSGMTIGTLIVSTVIFRALGFHGIEGMVTSLVVGAFVCIAMCMAGDISQDLKTGFLVGATPWRQQIAQIIGAFSSSLFVAAAVIWMVPYIQNKTFEAPQANMMQILIRGIMEGNLPWLLIILGAFIAILIEAMGVSALAFAIGLYLPFQVSAPLVVGGFLAYLTRKKFSNPEEFKDRNEKGVLVASGFIAGDALMGLLVLLLSARGLTLPAMMPGSEGMFKYLETVQWPAVLLFTIAAAFLWLMLTRKEAAQPTVLAPVCETPQTETRLNEQEIDEFGNPIINIPYHTDAPLTETSVEIQEKNKDEKE